MALRMSFSLGLTVMELPLEGLAALAEENKLPTAALGGLIVCLADEEQSNQKVRS